MTRMCCLMILNAFFFKIRNLKVITGTSYVDYQNVTEPTTSFINFLDEQMSANE